MPGSIIYTHSDPEYQGQYDRLADDALNADTIIAPDDLNASQILQRVGQVELPITKINRTVSWRRYLFTIFPHLVYLSLYLIQVIYAVVMLPLFLRSPLIWYNLVYGLIGFSITIIRLDYERPISRTKPCLSENAMMVVGFGVDIIMYILTMCYSGIILLDSATWLDSTLLFFTAINLLFHYTRFGITLFAIRIILWVNPVGLLIR